MKWKRSFFGEYSGEYYFIYRPQDFLCAEETSSLNLLRRSLNRSGEESVRAVRNRVGSEESVRAD